MRTMIVILNDFKRFLNVYCRHDSNKWKTLNTQRIWISIFEWRTLFVSRLKDRA